ncbi:DUF423 domain-containing protein [Nonlabens ponticola]|uniref:DUF423 domain-containing protein n=1 Tax=Nonlabens ponticola TaxID=2496866 RepID=A0A3S9MUP8_9FLAO|nr:DUF423 domain-containing protein [Nonlabens ponticola]AZQ42898.1 DUF423 domain-containing protein [Nonlabens ponticola]
MKKLLIVGVLFMVTGVILGALGAHALENYLSIDQLDSFETGVRYQIYHGLALLIISQISLIKNSQKQVVLYLFTIGSLLFSLSIYLLATRPIHEISVEFLGPITPIGGLLLISGWIYLLFKLISHKGVNNT